MARKAVVLTLAVIVLLAVATALFVFVLGPERWPWTARTATATPTLSPTATATPAPTSTPTPTLMPSATPLSRFGRITFGTALQVEGETQLLNQGMTFPAGTEEVYAQWSYYDMRDGLPWKLCWFLDNTPWSCESLTWDISQLAASGKAYTTSIRESLGLPPGNFRLELFIGDRQVQFATFMIMAPIPQPTDTPTPTPTPAPSEQEVLREAARALVRIWIPERAYGSGSIIDGNKGLILTNWHVVDNELGELVEDESVGVFITPSSDLKPQFAFWARVLEWYSDREADLAILQITHHKEQSDPVELPLNLPAIPIGDSDDVRRGDRLTLLGYPDYAEDTLSWTEGTVAALTEEWIETDALASYGHSGGMGLNEQGQLIGVISQLKLTGFRTGTMPWERAVQVSLIRPIDVAKPLIEGAVTGMLPPSPAPPVDEGYSEKHMVVLGVDELNLRQGPGLDRPILAQMPLGTVVEVLRAPEWDGARFWYNVRVPQSGQEGWASEFYLASFELARSPVLFTSSQAGSEDIYQVYPDGTGLRQLTSAPGHEFDPSWSPDASHIVFGYRQDGNADLYTMEADGAAWQQLTYTAADEVHPAWSPDGQRIAYVSDADGDWEIFVLNRDTGQVQQLTSNDAWDSFPSWSPDGTRLVFTSRQTGNYDLFVVDVNTLQVLQLTTSPYSDAHASWSPQGDEIVYTMVVAEGGALQRELGVLSLQDPGHPRRATFSDPGEALHRYPDWSPDGRFVVFVSGDGEAARLYVKPAGGTYMVGITEASLAVSSAPSWAR